MSKTYSDWLGCQVVLQIETKESQVPLHGLIVNESNHALRFRLDGRWEVDIYKEMISRVEADDYETFYPRRFDPGNAAPAAAFSNAKPMPGWSGVMDRWWSRHSSSQLGWKTLLSEGLAGSFLFLLSLQVSTQGPITFLARFLCGYLGLLFCALSLGCAVWVLMDSPKSRSIFAKWPKLFASFLAWCRQPLHL